MSDKLKLMKTGGDIVGRYKKQRVPLKCLLIIVQS